MPKTRRVISSSADGLMLDALAARVGDIRRNLEEQQRAFNSFSTQLFVATNSTPAHNTLLGGANLMSGSALAGAVENFRVLDEMLTKYRAAAADGPESEPS